MSNTWSIKVNQIVVVTGLDETEARLRAGTFCDQAIRHAYTVHSRWVDRAAGRRNDLIDGRADLVKIGPWLITVDKEDQ